MKELFEDTLFATDRVVVERNYKSNRLYRTVLEVNGQRYIERIITAGGTSYRLL
ncbi:hypothetical protein THF1D04_20298 [Vibrio owensii]|uniref:Uncharacterized protein n=1 Tax=Vibrio owensii TaxID=696485 RepID=A0AAU9Q3K4_9VIBR|nr:hypothetical protein THF1D04_20298 [Vibrio owensii]